MLPSVRFLFAAALYLSILLAACAPAATPEPSGVGSAPTAEVLTGSGTVNLSGDITASFSVANLAALASEGVVEITLVLADFNGSVTFRLSRDLLTAGTLTIGPAGQAQAVFTGGGGQVFSGSEGTLTLSDVNGLLDGSFEFSAFGSTPGGASTITVGGIFAGLSTADVP